MRHKTEGLKWIEQSKKVEKRRINVFRKEKWEKKRTRKKFRLLKVGKVVRKKVQNSDTDFATKSVRERKNEKKSENLVEISLFKWWKFLFFSHFYACLCQENRVQTRQEQERVNKWVWLCSKFIKANNIVEKCIKKVEKEWSTRVSSRGTSAWNEKKIWKLNQVVALRSFL